MSSQCLKIGTILDDRYQIEEVLGQGGFGITYRATRVSLGITVAVKELFWKGHCLRDRDNSIGVELDAADMDSFAVQKNRFMREARIIREFADDPGIVHVQDYFEANNTAYIVMEYVEGITIGEYVKKNGVIPAETAMRKILPLLESLEHIHRNGMAHLDISPDNIMIRPDGSLKLIDFGASRSISMAQRVSAVITKDNYAAPEQYYDGGNLGAHTDIYALCATLYMMVSNTAPDKAPRRLFLDELKAPSAWNVKIDKKYEAIIMRGLQLEPSARFCSAAQLAEEIRNALPKERAEVSPRRRMITLAVLALLLAGVVVLSCALYRVYNPIDKFRNIKTETFLIQAPERMSAAAFASAETELRARLNDFAGKDNYIITREDAQYRIIVPLACFDDREVSAVIKEKFCDIGDPNGSFKYSWQLAANWEIPGTSVLDGKFQIDPAEFTENTLAYVYKWNSRLTAGQHANLIADFKTRLDAFETPYAFGTLYGDASNSIVFRIAPEYMSRFVINTLGTNSLCLRGSQSSYPEMSLYSSSGSLTVEYDEPGAALHLTLSDYSARDLNRLTTALRENGMRDLLLTVGYSTSPGFAACVNFDQPIEDGCLDISDSDFLFEGSESAVKGTIRYIKTFLADTKLPVSCSMTAYGVIDSRGETLFGEYRESMLGVTLRTPDPILRDHQAAKEKLTVIAENEGYSIAEQPDANAYFIEYGLSQYGNCPRLLFETTTRLIRQYALTDIPRNTIVYFTPFKEPGDSRIRMVLISSFDNDTNTYKWEVRCLFSVDPWSVYFDEFTQLWNNYDWASLGVEANTLLPLEPGSNYKLWGT